MDIIAQIETNIMLASFGYTVLYNIGDGGFGQVKLATSRRHSKNMAIKILHRRRKSHTEVNDFLDRELTMLRILRHPNIVQVHEIIEMPGGKVFIVMEAAEMDLYKKINRVGYIPVNQAKKWFSQLVSAMVYMHDQDIVHRDINCGNVLLTADNQAKLTDFGLADFSQGFPVLAHCGTLEYLAPEILMGVPYNPKKSDVWSLGVLLFVMLTGHLPFRNSGPIDLLLLQHTPLEYLWWLGRSCRDLFSKMLEVNPYKRPSMAMVAQHPWLLPCHKRLLLGCRRLGSRKNDQKKADSSSISVSSSSEEAPKPAPAAPKEEPELLKQQSGPSSSVSIEAERTSSSASEEDVFFSSDKESVNADSEVDHSAAAAASVEDAKEKSGCFASLRKRLKKIFRSKSSSVPAASSPVALGGPSCEQRRVNGTPDIPLPGPGLEAEDAPPQPTKRLRVRWLRFPRFKVEQSSEWKDSSLVKVPLHGSMVRLEPVLQRPTVTQETRRPSEASAPIQMTVSEGFRSS